MTKLKTINIKGKEYVEVNERLRYFRITYPNFSLITEVLQCTEEHCVMKATILNEHGVAVATGHAHETKTGSFINKTSFVEVCETSAWGRALGNFGIGIDSSVASADEVNNAIQTQGSGGGSKPKNKPTEKKKLNTAQFNSMMEHIRDGQALLVSQKMNSYSLTESQRKLLEAEIEKQS
tara:strand:+ start:452 stop:988 length:537 start_codon:yes stop_codon:yes gene_type:complete